MNINEIPSGIKSGLEKIDFSQIHRDFSQTKYGNILSQNIRWARYKPENMTNEKWVKLLGADANNLEHLKLTYGTTRAFIKYSSKETPLTTEEQEDLLLAATVHDWGEAIIGDINYDLKTPQDEIRELEELEKMVKEMYGEKNSQLSSRVDTVINNIINGHNTKLGKMFNAIERIGYLRTALHVWKKTTGEISTELKRNLDWISCNVLLGSLTQLMEYSKTYPPVALYLKENKEIITDIFNNLPEESFLKYDPKEVEQKKQKFNTVRQAWQEYYLNLTKDTK